MEIVSLDGKWKVSQNRSREDMDGVIGGLEAQDHPHAREIAKLARTRLVD